MGMMMLKLTQYDIVIMRLIEGELIATVRRIETYNIKG